MSFMDDYLRRLSDDITQLQAQLGPLESGNMQIRSRKLGGEWVDETPKQIENLKKGIAAIKAILAKYSTESERYPNA
jgi:hypothetical protein